MKLPSRFFDYTSAVVLFITALVKFVSGLGHNRILDYSDPVFHIDYRSLFIGSAVAEVAVAVWFMVSNSSYKYYISLWLGSAFVMYHILLGYLAPGKWCPCLGTLTGAAHVSPEVADYSLKAFSVYLLVGSAYFIIINSKRISKVKAP
jgi:hypothetical protein